MHAYAAPLALWAATFAGLGIALLYEGAADTAALLLLACPLLVVAWRLTKPSGA